MLKPNTLVFPFQPDLDFPLYTHVYQRVRDFPNSTPDFTRMIMARLVMEDQYLLVLVATHEGKLIGHWVSELLDKTLHIQQASVDPGFPRVIDISLALADNWAKSRGASLYRMEVPLHPPEIWDKAYKRYGFRVKSYIVERNV